MTLLSTEPRTVLDLRAALLNRSDVPKPYSVAVEALLFDQDQFWILMERGPECRDQIGMFEGIGGGVDGDGDLRSELLREFREEAGSAAGIDILRFFEVRLDTIKLSADAIRSEDHWVIVSYLCFLRSGPLEICEPGKNVGFKRVPLHQADPSVLSSSAQAALSSMKAQWAVISRLLSSHVASTDPSL